MNAEERRPPADDASRVRVRTRVVRRGDVIPLTTDSLQGTLREAERRFLSLQNSAMADAPPGVLSEYLAILADLRVVDGHLREMSGRRDITYSADRRLTYLNNHCRWLTRRVSAECLLVLQVQLEQEFRRVISPDAYQMFLRLEEIEDAGREIEAFSNRELMNRLHEGTLVREAVDQAHRPTWR